MKKLHLCGVAFLVGCSSPLPSALISLEDSGTPGMGGDDSSLQGNDVMARAPDAALLDSTTPDSWMPEGSVVAATDSATADVHPTICAPGDVSGFTPVWKPPTAFHQNHCSSPQIANFYTYCIGPAQNTTQCNNWQTANSACEACIVTAEGSGVYGPLIYLSNGFAQLNYAGCIYNANASDQACAEAYQPLVQCENAACETNCPSGTSSQAFGACQQNAQAGGCASYLAAQSCTNAITNLDPAYACFSGSDFQTNYTTLATAFCGP